MVLFDGCSDVSIDFEQFPLGLLVRITLPLFFSTVFCCYSHRSVSIGFKGNITKYTLVPKIEVDGMMMMMTMVTMLASVHSDLHNGDDDDDDDACLYSQ